MRCFRIAFVLLMLNVSALSFANAAYDACIKKSQSTQGILECNASLLELLDKDLNKTYQELMGVLPEKGRALLKQAESDWISYRRTQCDWESYVDYPGTMYKILYSSCFVQETETRLKHLKDALATFQNR